MSHDDPLTILSEQECWERLGRREFGRLAYTLTDEVHIVPINYAVQAGRILFRSAEGGKLLGVVMHGEVAFEIDDVDEDRELAWSVVARGRAAILEGRAVRDADNLPLRPWVEGDKLHIVAIGVTEISGREFHLARPWRHMLPQR